TKLYPPIGINKIIPNCDSFDEDKYTLKLMAKYGIDNVRGGSFCSVQLDTPTIRSIEHMLEGATNKCFQCGSSDQFIKNCTKRARIKVLKCERCGYYGHTNQNCYARKYRKVSISNDTNVHCSKCDSNVHSNDTC